MKVWKAIYTDPNAGNAFKELYSAENKLVTQAILLRDIAAGLIASAEFLGEVQTK